MVGKGYTWFPLIGIRVCKSTLVFDEDDEVVGGDVVSGWWWEYCRLNVPYSINFGKAGILLGRLILILK